MYTLNRSEQFGTRRTSAPADVPCQRAISRNHPQRCGAEPHVPAGRKLASHHAALRRLALVHHVHRFAHFPKRFFSQRAHGGIAVM